MNPNIPLNPLDIEQPRSLAARLFQNVEVLDKGVLHQKNYNQQLFHESAQLKRHRFAKRSASFSPGQTSLLDALDVRYAMLDRLRRNGTRPGAPNTTGQAQRVRWQTATPSARRLGSPLPTACRHPIGIGDDLHRPRPCHTTRHAGPHRAVREIEVMRDVPIPACRTTQY